MAFEKVDNNTIKEVSSKDIFYKYSELLEQKKRNDDRAEYYANKRDEDNAKIAPLIAECVKLGLKEPITKI